jgi:hypothetical protein
MRQTHRLFGLGLAGLLTATAVGLPLRAADEPIDYVSLEKIKTEGYQNSQVMEIASWLTDVHGPRLSGSPNIQQAGEWAVAEMQKWGLTNVALEPWTENRGFERGWTNDKFYLAAVDPQSFPIPGTPRAWTPGTDGLIRGQAILVTETEEADLQQYVGKLRGAFVLPSAPPDVPAFWEPQARRLTGEDLDRRAAPRVPAAEFGAGGGRAGRGGAGAGRGGRGGRGSGFSRDEFFREQGVAMVFATHARGHGIYSIGGANRSADPATLLPNISIPAEQYGRIARMLQKGIAVTMEADIRNTFHPAPAMFNVVGEIRGTDKADEIVMLGAHFDSWHSSTGATDNAAGSAAMMEAMRILKASGVPLRRTVRIGLWNGEEQGLNGSRNYVEAHFASREAAPGGGGAGGRGGRGNQGPLVLKPAHAAFSAYYNIDNGTGAIRGVYQQSNAAVGPIFAEWIHALRDLGLTHLSISNTGGTDHQAFDGVGLPGFQFIQDPVEYNTLTHHYNLDSYERLQPDDMIRNATVAAAFAFLTANREDLLPRKPLPAPGGRGGN